MVKPQDFNEDYIRRVAILNPSPWDEKRLYLNRPTPKDLQVLPDNLTTLLQFRPNPYPDQGNIGSCVGWSHALWMYVTSCCVDATATHDLFSAWDAYTLARKYDYLIDGGEGSTNLGGMKALQKMGICYESCLPTPKDMPTVKLEPCSDYPNQKYGTDYYYEIPRDVGSFRSAMFGQISQPSWKGAVPIVIGFKVPRSFLNAGSDGIVPYYKVGEQMLGCHSTLIVGYEKIDGKFYGLNFGTWGDDVGLGGLFKIPLENYLTSGLVIDAFVGRNGAPLAQNPDPSTCPVAKIWTGIYNVVNSFVGGKTRLKAVVPDE